jgi:hypothetical protein
MHPAAPLPLLFPMGTATAFLRGLSASEEPAGPNPSHPDPRGRLWVTTAMSFRSRMPPAMLNGIRARSCSEGKPPVRVLCIELAGGAGGALANFFVKVAVLEPVIDQVHSTALPDG